MAYAIVGQVEFSKNGTSQANVSAPAFTPVAGNFLLCCVWVDGDQANLQTETTIDDSTGSNDSWTLISGASITAPVGSLRVYYLENAAAVSTTVRAAFSANKDYPSIYVVEVSGLDAAPVLDSKGQRQDTPGTGTDAVTSGNTGTLSSQPALVFGFAYQTTGLETPAAGTGFTGLSGVWNYEGTEALAVRPEHKRVTATTAVAATATIVNGATNNETWVVVLKESVAAAVAQLNDVMLFGSAM